LLAFRSNQPLLHRNHEERAREQAIFTYRKRERWTQRYLYDDRRASPLPLQWLVRAVCALCYEKLSRDATVVAAPEKMVSLEGRMMRGCLGGTHFRLATGC